jgi:hypothetical protein
MAVSTIDQFIDGLSEDWMKSVFIDRLENARLLVDDETFGDKTNANNALANFLQLTTDQRLAEIERLRVRNTVTQWAKKATAGDINSLITVLRTIRDTAGQNQPTEPEPETPVETGEVETDGEGENTGTGE